LEGMDVNVGTSALESTFQRVLCMTTTAQNHQGEEAPVRRTHDPTTPQDFNNKHK